MCKSVVFDELREQFQLAIDLISEESDGHDTDSEYSEPDEPNPSFSIDAFAAKWNELYYLLDEFGFREEHDQEGSRRTHSHLSYPPHPNLSPLLETMDLHPLARELLGKLVFPIEQGMYLAPDIIAVTYLAGTDNNIKSLRNPTLHHLSTDEVEAGELSRNEILLTDGWYDGYGRMLVLNFVTGTMLEIDVMELGEDTGPDKYPDNTPRHDAMALLDSYHAKYRNLEWIPIESGMFEDSIVYRRSPFEQEYDRFKAVVLEKYGWPDNFRHEAWMKERREQWYAAGE